jgi:endoplasmic reticulum-Golgi intermediate compartment protein 1
LQDELSNHITDLPVQKIRVDKLGAMLEDSNSTEENNQKAKKVAEMIKNEEGCRIFGSFEMDMVPGNFHVSYHANTVIFEKLMMQNSSLVQKLGANYRLESLSFGEGVSKSKLVRRLP